MFHTVSSRGKTQTSAATRCAAGSAVSLLFTPNVHNSWQIWLSPLFILYFIWASSTNAHEHINYAQLCTSTHSWCACTFFFRLWDASSGTRSETGDWHPLVSTSVTLPAACEVGTEQQSEALGNICGQLHGEGGSEGKKLAFNKQDNGCHTPLLTPPPLQPAISLSLSLPSPSLSTRSLTFSIKITFIV